ncbi:hypothetical protein BTVI_23625 [Pitangus sulphuratus]|nr:hypothetical protein BTVI_23625 [Pitangus sulphuratus]
MQSFPWNNQQIVEATSHGPRVTLALGNIQILQIFLDVLFLVCCGLPKDCLLGDSKELGKIMLICDTLNIYMLVSGIDCCIGIHCQLWSVKKLIAKNLACMDKGEEENGQRKEKPVSFCLSSLTAHTEALKWGHTKRKKPAWWLQWLLCIHYGKIVSDQPLIAFSDEMTGLVDERRAEDVVYSDGNRALATVSHSSISAAKVVKIGWTDGKLAVLPKDYDQWCGVQLACDY